MSARSNACSWCGGSGKLITDTIGAFSLGYAICDSCAKNVKEINERLEAMGDKGSDTK